MTQNPDPGMQHRTPTGPTDPPRDGRTDAVVERGSGRGTDAPGAGLTKDGHVRHTRAGAWWTALVVAALLSIVFLVFIAQNAEAVTIQFLTFEGELSLAVALLLSAATGVLVAAIPGIARIAQLRRALAKNAKRH